MNNVNRREKVFYIIMIIFYFLFPFIMFFDVYEYKYKAKTTDGNIVQVVHKYNITNINYESNFALVISILLFIISLIFAVFLIIDLVKGKFYRIHIKILSGIALVLCTGLVHYMSVYLGTILFMLVCCNLFILSFDYRLTKKRGLNLLIYIPTYVMFLIMLVLSFGFIR